MLFRSARRGTASGLVDHVRLVTGGEVELLETGGTAWSVDPGSPLPGLPTPDLVVRVRVADPSSVDQVRLDRLVTSIKPAHVPHRLEIIGGDGLAGSGDGGAAGPGPGARRRVRTR